MRVYTLGRLHVGIDWSDSEGRFYFVDRENSRHDMFFALSTIERDGIRSWVLWCGPLVIMVADLLQQRVHQSRGE